jgi:prolyl 4-hydroxylase
MRVIEGTKYIITKWFRESAWIKDHVPTYRAGPAADMPGA